MNKKKTDWYLMIPIIVISTLIATMLFAQYIILTNTITTHELVVSLIVTGTVISIFGVYLGGLIIEYRRWR